MIYEMTNNGLKISLFYFVETFLTKMALRFLDKLFKRNLEKLIKFYTFLDAFTARSLTSLLFQHPVAKFNCAKIEKETHLGDIIGKNIGLRLFLDKLFLL